MKDLDRYHKWVDRNEDYQVYVGKCLGLISGIYGENPASLYSQLSEVVQGVTDQFIAEGRSLPNPRVRPKNEVA
jgi:hypothetical protein